MSSRFISRSSSIAWRSAFICISWAANMAAILSSLRSRLSLAALDSSSIGTSATNLEEAMVEVSCAGAVEG